MCALEIYFTGNIATFTYRVFFRILSICLTWLFSSSRRLRWKYYLLVV